jgi:hypothetical protein
MTIFFFFKNLTVYERWKNTVEPYRPQVTKWPMRFAYWIHKATNTHSEHLIFIAIPLQLWLHERASVLRYTCIACHVYSYSCY